MPFHFSWCERTIGTTPYGNCTRARISDPTIGWIFIFSNSSGVSLPGFEMMCSGTASLPMSCRMEAARSACNSPPSETHFLAELEGIDLHPL